MSLITFGARLDTVRGADAASARSTAARRPPRRDGEVGDRRPSPIEIPIPHLTLATD